jgi:hypothetical protein
MRLFLVLTGLLIVGWFLADWQGNDILWSMIFIFYCMYSAATEYELHLKTLEVKNLTLTLLRMQVGDQNNKIDYTNTRNW